MRRTLLAALVVAFVAAACDGGDGRSSFPRQTPVGSPTRDDSWVIGVVGTLSTPDDRTIAHGQDAYEGADLAVQQLNARLGDGDRPYELVTLDDEGDPERARDAVERLAGSERTVGIVYAGPPAALPAAERALARARIPAVLCFGDLYSARRLSPHVFQASPPYLWQARVLARYLLRDRGYENVTLVTSGDLTGSVAASSLRTAFRERGARTPRVIEWRSDAGSLASRLLRSDPEAVVVQGAPAQTRGLMEALARRQAAYRGTARARIASADRAKVRRRHARAPRPQVASFDAGFGALSVRGQPVVGSVVAGTYARGAHYLPIPNFQRFARAFERWWDEVPVGWELRGYDAAQAIGWAHRNAAEGEDIARALETMTERRFGGLPITLGPDDHTFVGMTHIGLWVRPRSGLELGDERLSSYRRLPRESRYVPLQRAFSIDGTRTAVLPEDWRHLFSGKTDPRGPAPDVKRARFGVATGPADPMH